MPELEYILSAGVYNDGFQLFDNFLPLLEVMVSKEGLPRSYIGHDPRLIVEHGIDLLLPQIG